MFIIKKINCMICLLLFVIITSVNAFCNDDAINEWLSKQPINLDEKCKNSGGTLMHIAASDGRLDVLKWLKNQGSNVNAKDNAGKTPAYFAKLHKYEQIMQWFADIYAVGAIIKFGDYDWRILDVQDGKALILTEMILERVEYHNTDKPVTWSVSNLRKYLNGEFFQSFTQADRNRILDTNVVTGSNPWFRINGGAATTDKIFLLSLEEVVLYFGDSGKLKNRPNNNTYIIDDQYNSSRIVYDKDEKASWWWLRSPGEYTTYAAFVYFDGCVYVCGNSALDFYFGVRPALWIAL